MTKTYSPLDASKEKVNRAKSKFSYLKAAINRYIQSNPHSVRIEREGSASYVITRLDKDIPVDLAWETVEAVGHLRDALDKLMVELAEFNGRGTSRVHFPFGGVDENGQPYPFPDARLDQMKKKFTAAQWDAVVAQKPYPGGNDTLWSINQIANADKHRSGLVELFPRLKIL